MMATRMAVAPTLLATGFIADTPDEGTVFPSAGGNSGDPRVQAIYWRCIVMFFASARITNPTQRLALFSNVAPPVVDGVDIAAVFDRYGVECRRVALNTRLAQGRTKSWGNVLYFHDILESLGGESDDLRFALADSDVLVTRDLAALWHLLDAQAYAGYVVGTAADEMVNGLPPRQMTAIAGAIGGTGDAGIVDHYGGELLALRIETLRQDREVFRNLVEATLDQTGPAAGILTEEHIFSIAFALMPGKVASANAAIKRIWFSARFNTARPGDKTRRSGICPPKSAMASAICSTILPPRAFRPPWTPMNFAASRASAAGSPPKLSPNRAATGCGR